MSNEPLYIHKASQKPSIWQPNSIYFVKDSTTNLQIYLTGKDPLNPVVATYKSNPVEDLVDVEFLAKVPNINMYRGISDQDLQLSGNGVLVASGSTAYHMLSNPIPVTEDQQLVIVSNTGIPVIGFYTHEGPYALNEVADSFYMANKTHIRITVPPRAKFMTLNVLRPTIDIGIVVFYDVYEGTDYSIYSTTPDQEYIYTLDYGRMDKFNPKNYHRPQFMYNPYQQAGQISGLHDNIPFTATFYGNVVGLNMLSMVMAESIEGQFIIGPGRTANGSIIPLDKGAISPNTTQNVIRASKTRHGLTSTYVGTTWQTGPDKPLLRIIGNTSTSAFNLVTDEDISYTLPTGSQTLTCVSHPNLAPLTGCVLTYSPITLYETVLRKTSNFTADNIAINESVKDIMLNDRIVLTNTIERISRSDINNAAKKIKENESSNVTIGIYSPSLYTVGNWITNTTEIVDKFNTVVTKQYIAANNPTKYRTVNALGFYKPDTDAMYFVPGLAPLGEGTAQYNFTTGTTKFPVPSKFTSDMTTPDTELVDRILVINPNTKYGVAVGILPVLDYNKRSKEANNVYSMIDSTSYGVELNLLDYSHIVNDDEFPVIDSSNPFEFATFRTYFNVSESRLASYVVRSDYGTFIYMDWVVTESVIDEVPMPADIRGRNFEIVSATPNARVLANAVHAVVPVYLEPLSYEGITSVILKLK